LHTLSRVSSSILGAGRAEGPAEEPPGALCWQEGSEDAAAGSGLWPGAFAQLGQTNVGPYQELSNPPRLFCLDEALELLASQKLCSHGESFPRGLRSSRGWEVAAQPWEGDPLSPPLGRAASLSQRVMGGCGGGQCALGSVAKARPRDSHHRRQLMLPARDPPEQPCGISTPLPT